MEQLLDQPGADVIADSKDIAGPAEVAVNFLDTLPDDRGIYLPLVNAAVEDEFTRQNGNVLPDKEQRRALREATLAYSAIKIASQQP